MEKYEPSKIEPKWQKCWEEHPELSAADDAVNKPKYYCLDMFPYPSGDGLHVGHVESYTATDIVSRFKRMNGKNVLHPQGWDAFGLPAENYAIKTGTHPDLRTHQNIANFTRQIKSLGMSYDWSREIDTSNPEYYKWTQWLFLLFYKNGLAYKKMGKVNWCPSCQTVLANEQVEDGICERCKNEVIQKDLEQWYFKITDFIENNKETTGLIEGLGKVDWPGSTIAAQKNWIGKSEGVEFKFKVKNSDSEISVYTTRIDTVFGVTYVVVGPEHRIIKGLKDKISNIEEVETYVAETKKKTDLERMEAKVKTGVELRGIKVINPFSGQEVPLFVADYVLSQYGTGAVMAVPAHDERDFEFAKKYDLPIKRVIEPKFIAGPGSDSAIMPGQEYIKRSAIAAVIRNPKDDTYLCISWKTAHMHGIVTGGVDEGEDIVEAARREVLEETGYKNLKLVKISDKAIHSLFYHRVKKQNRWARFQYVIFDLIDEQQEAIDEKEAALHEIIWKKKEELRDFFSVIEGTYIMNLLDNIDSAFTDDGVVYNSGEYDWMDSSEARKKMAQWLEKEGIGKKKINYKLRDWLVSRQRYWGAPIPIIYCDKCGAVPVPEKDLPVMLPTDVDFKPIGESPLAYSKTFHDVVCPKCGGKARRESDTMDTFVCSSWYYFRYSDPKNREEFASKENIKKWLPVDLYVGGAEHSVLHLLYARFFTKALHNLGYVGFDEPFLKLRHQGMILAEDGRKMSKSLGNVINPDVVVKEFGADSLRIFEMFMGPFDAMKPWNTKGIVGMQRFLDKVWRFSETVSDSNEPDVKIQSLLHKTIKKVTADIEDFHFNTAVSQLMILANAMEKETVIFKDEYGKFLILLSPFAPHIAEELWSRIGNDKSIFLESWPEYDAELAKDEEAEVVIQVNGKVRDKMTVSADMDEEEMKALAIASEKVQAHISGKEIRKIIVVKGRLVSIVV
ncbi:MAG: leucine--tRNA ligase [Candidatus Moranbacteria bacterium]|nr:leucine--tRNA ligase [Candidatus Moranbacteria bacterium]